MDDWTATGAPGFRHAALLYQTSEDFTIAALDFVQAGLAAGEAVLVASTTGSSARIRSRLGRLASPVQLAGLSRLGANPGRVLAMLRVFAGQDRDRPVRCVQQLYWPGRPLDELREAMRLEVLASEALAGTPVSLLCAYDASCDPGLLARAERAHQAIRRDGHWQASSLPAGHDGATADLDDQLPPPPAGAAGLQFRTEQATVRSFVAAHARQAGLPSHRVTDLVLAAGELAANTLTHTDDLGTLTMWTAEGAVICQVSDTGRIADPLAGTLRPDPSGASKQQGLWLVHQVGDLVQIRSGPAGTTIRVHMRLTPDAHPTLPPTAAP